MSEFNPTEHNAQEVKDHLAKADPEEFVRVLEAESVEAGGKGRKSVLEFTQDSEDLPEPSEDGYTRVIVSS